MIVIIKNALENIKTNKLRVIVAMIWIVLGITSVVVVSSIGNGIEHQGKKTSGKEEFRKSVISFYPNHESNLDPSFYEPFTQEDIGVLSGMNSIERVTPKYGDNTGGGYGANIYLNGNYKFIKTIEYKKGSKIDIAYGRSFSIEDLDRKTIVIDYSVAYDLGNEVPQNAIGKSINVDGEYFEVIGVLKEVKQNDNNEGSYIELESYLPKKALNELENKRSFGGPITGLEILAKKGYDKDEIGFDALDKIKEGKSEDSGEYILTGDESGAFELIHMQNIINRFTTILSNVSLMIGGIGIMNIMYMSVAERKREIGIRRAIGAEPRDILLQFLIETIVITILGGILGMIVGTIAAYQVGPYIGIPAIPSAGVYVKALVVSILTGAIFGAIPALKAANLDPIKAIQG
ncbi:MAG: ABC transporter permease [Paraclostridium sp.]|uniref:ABC transporter permease n=1 Tax=Paraclostridium sp. TaxID=2023273 RepID=UPI003F2B7366